MAYNFDMGLFIAFVVVWLYVAFPKVLTPVFYAFGLAVILFWVPLLLLGRFLGFGQGHREQP